MNSPINIIISFIFGFSFAYFILLSSKMNLVLNKFAGLSNTERKNQMNNKELMTSYSRERKSYLIKLSMSAIGMTLSLITILFIL